MVKTEPTGCKESGATIEIACSRLSVSEDDRKSERAMSGIWESPPLLLPDPAHRPTAFSIVHTDREPRTGCKRSCGNARPCSAYTPASVSFWQVFHIRYRYLCIFAHSHCSRKIFNHFYIFKLINLCAPSQKLQTLNFSAHPTDVVSCVTTNSAD